MQGGDVTIARKSRKIEKEEAVGTSIINNVGLYARLSVEDSGKKDGNSIKNQIVILNNFVNAKVDLTYSELYCDNGETGTNFERPEWERLMQDIKKGKINCIVVKDLSRLGRNYIEVGNYIESVFPFLKVRFIAIYDHYDSQKEYFKECDMEVSLKNIVNDFYSKDISKKVLSSLNSKKKKGDFIGSITPYGYKRSEENKNKLVVDKVTAPFVKKIFEWKLNGLSDNKIANILNEDGVWSPNRYRYELGLRKDKKYECFLWQAQTIHLITDNLVYLGHMAQGKYNASIYKVRNKQRIPETDWIVVKNTHEGIIEENTYNKILELRNINRKRFKEHG